MSLINSVRHMNSVKRWSNGPYIDKDSSYELATFWVTISNTIIIDENISKIIKLKIIERSSIDSLREIGKPLRRIQ